MGWMYPWRRAGKMGAKITTEKILFRTYKLLIYRWFFGV